MSHVAYALREDYAGTVEQDGVQVPLYTGGSLAIDDDRQHFDVRAELDDGDGTIVVTETDLPLVIALDQYPPLKRVKVPAGRPPANPYAKVNAAGLRARASELGLEVHGQPKVDALRAGLLNADEHIAGGNTPRLVGLAEDGTLILAEQEA